MDQPDNAGTSLPRDRLNVLRVSPESIQICSFQTVLAEVGKVTLGTFYTIRIGNSRMKSKIGLKIPRHV